MQQSQQIQNQQGIKSSRSRKNKQTIQQNYLQAQIKKQNPKNQNEFLQNQKHQTPESFALKKQKSIQELIGLKITRYQNNNFRQKNHSNAKTLKLKTQPNKFNEDLIYSQFKFTPQPWQSEKEGQAYSLHKQYLMTQINTRTKRKSSWHKSFHVSIPRNGKLSHQRNKGLRSSSEINYYTGDVDYPPATSLSKKWQQKISSLNDDLSTKFNCLSQAYNYTDQQKARVSLDYIVHEKKQKKMTRMLKMKVHSFDKTLFKQQKVSHHSKNLIEALEKLSSDNILKKSIDRAVDVLKKRTTCYITKGKKSSDKSQNQLSPVKPTQPTIKWISCRKLGPPCEQYGHYSKQKNNNMVSTTKLSAQFEISKQSKILAQKQKCKVSFKPKRKWIIDGKQSKIINPNERQLLSQSMLKLDKVLKNQNAIDKLNVASNIFLPIKQPSNSFLKVNKFKKD